MGEHARLRTIVAPAFSNRWVKLLALLAQQVEAIAAQLFETLAAQPSPPTCGATSPSASGHGQLPGYFATLSWIICSLSVGTGIWQLKV